MSWGAIIQPTATYIYILVPGWVLSTLNVLTSSQTIYDIISIFQMAKLRQRKVIIISQVLSYSHVLWLHAIRTTKAIFKFSILKWFQIYSKSAKQYKVFIYLHLDFPKFNILPYLLHHFLSIIFPKCFVIQLHIQYC